MKRFLTLGCSVLAGWMVFFPNNTRAQARGGMAMAPHAAPMAVPRGMPAPRAMPAARPVARPAPVAGAKVGPAARVAGKIGAGNVVRVRTMNGVTHIIVRRSNVTLPVVTPVPTRVQPVIVEPIIEQVPPTFRTVPGLGFDFPHLAAIFGPEAVGAGRLQQLTSIGSFVPFFNGGFFLPQQPVVVEEEGADQAETSQKRDNEAAAETRPQHNASEEWSRPPAPPKDTPPYVLVKRDGTLVFAVAYSWENGNMLRYMTNQGLWGTVARDALDLDATQQFNEQRGVSFQAPSHG